MEKRNKAISTKRNGIILLLQKTSFILSNKIQRCQRCYWLFSFFSYITEDWSFLISLGEIVIIISEKQHKTVQCYFFKLLFKTPRQSLEIYMRFRFNEHSICMYYVCTYPIPSLMSGTIWMKLWKNIVIHKAFLMFLKIYYKSQFLGFSHYAFFIVPLQMRWLFLFSVCFVCHVQCFWVIIKYWMKHFKKQCRPAYIHITYIYKLLSSYFILW